MNAPEYEIQHGDVTEVPSDLLILKHAQEFYGADLAVADKLVSAGICDFQDIKPVHGEAVVVETRGAIAPKRVMFLGTPPLPEFGYDEMERFAVTAIGLIAKQAAAVDLVTTTVHGNGYGLDGGESLQRLVLGFRKGLGIHPNVSIRKIAFLTLGEREHRTLRSVLSGIDPTTGPSSEPTAVVLRTNIASEPVDRPLTESPKTETPLKAEPVDAPPAKKRVFVAMPYSDEFENVYEYGIYPAVRGCGFICEKVDKAHFTGDILRRITEGIESATIVIADLTSARPNVYLEVGYAWGYGKKVIFLAKKGEDLHFDVSTHRCIYYGKFGTLAEELECLLRGLEATGGI
ncbi:MAG: hypothetical protein P4L46_01585 [Fimbriimonas sp.]|nr:hypothetical protein [Fimbriimonas sp.]